MFHNLSLYNNNDKVVILAGKDSYYMENNCNHRNAVTECKENMVEYKSNYMVVESCSYHSSCKLVGSYSYYSKKRKVMGSNYCSMMVDSNSHSSGCNMGSNKNYCNNHNRVEFSDGLQSLHACLYGHTVVQLYLLSCCHSNNDILMCLEKGKNMVWYMKSTTVQLECYLSCLCNMNCDKVSMASLLSSKMVTENSNKDCLSFARVVFDNN